ncbi:MAG: GNAT family N-acetyltransferase [Candidatus Melainabacteria bacterium]|nr:GNAT family N-acetyltransferase [Candidatus Melainabacteria bacterium]
MKETYSAAPSPTGRLETRHRSEEEPPTADTVFTLRDGSVAVIRDLTAEDKSSLNEIMDHLSPDSVYMRFLTAKVRLSSKELAYFTEIDQKHHVALLASIRQDNHLVPVGVARYIQNTPAGDEAEVAFTIEDNYQNLGIGTLLLKKLTQLAFQAGIKTFTALVLPENRKMLNLFGNSHLAMTRTTNSAGALEIKLTICDQTA